MIERITHMIISKYKIITSISKIIICKTKIIKINNYKIPSKIKIITLEITSKIKILIKQIYKVSKILNFKLPCLRILSSASIRNLLPI